MMPELGMDMFDTDMPAVPGLPNNGPEEEVQAPPEETMMEPVQATDAEPLQEEHATAAEAMPDQGIHVVDTVPTLCAWLALLSNAADDGESSGCNVLHKMQPVVETYYLQLQGDVTPLYVPHLRLTWST